MCAVLFGVYDVLGLYHTARVLHFAGKRITCVVLTVSSRHVLLPWFILFDIPLVLHDGEVDSSAFDPG